MAEQQKAFNPDQAAMDAVSSIQAIIALGKIGAQKSAQIQDIIADTIRAALSHAEGEATPDYVLDALDNLMHDNYERSYRGAKNRQDDAELIRCALRRSHPAPAGDTLSHAEGAVDREGLADALYLAGYSAARKERDYDPRGCDQWQAVVDAIRAHPAPQVAVPEGWKLVPVEPTVEMRKSAKAAVGPYISNTCWNAMLAAAPAVKESLTTAGEPVAPEPDVAALVEALESAKNLIANHSGEALPDKYAGDQIEQIDAALAALAPDEREIAARPGYAGVTVWVGDQECTQVVDRALLETSRADELLRHFENARHLLRAGKEGE